MSERRRLAAERLKQAYSRYYDIEERRDPSGLDAVLAYHDRESQYVLVKSAELWAAERHEYIYLWSVDRLDGAKAEEIFGKSVSDGEPRVKPHSQHMYTYLTAVVLYDTADPDALQKIKQMKKRREYKLSLHGWMEFRIAAVDLSNGDLTVNRAGKRMEKDLKRLMGYAIPKNLGEEKTL